jgi:hypothetical protein
MASDCGVMLHVNLRATKRKIHAIRSPSEFEGNYSPDEKAYVEALARVFVVFLRDVHRCCPNLIGTKLPIRYAIRCSVRPVWLPQFGLRGG